MDENSSQERAAVRRTGGSVGATKGDFWSGWEVGYPCCSVLLQCGGFIIRSKLLLHRGVTLSLSF